MQKKIGLLFLLILFSGCQTAEISEEDRYPMYKQAYLDLNDGKYDEAIEVLAELKDYLDGEDLYYEAVYRRLLKEAEDYLQTQKNFGQLEEDYLILSYDNRNQAMQDQQGLYLELLIVAAKIHSHQPIDCETDFYYYQPESFWDNFESLTVLNSEQLIEIVREYKSDHEKDCVFYSEKE